MSNTSDEHWESKSKKTLSLDGLCLLGPEIGPSESWLKLTVSFPSRYDYISKINIKFDNFTFLVNQKCAHI